MLNKKNVYLWSKNMNSGSLIPLLWFSAKTYYEENGSNVEQWAWQDPFIHDRSIEDILNYLTLYPPTIFGLSVYVWSYELADQLAKEIRSRWPKCLIIYGGPQNDIKYSEDFFIKKPWVDLVVPSDVYGEPILTYILDNYDNLKHHQIPEVYYQRSGIKFRSKHELKKRDFVWPKNIFAQQKEYLNFERKDSWAIYETTRGCPYRCIYCDWGGGTYTKVIKKPIETIRSELESLAAAKIEFLIIADANFGIYKEDLDIIEYIIELKNKYGYPLTVNIENAKNNLDRVIKIQKLMIKNQLSSFYKISVQSPDDVVKANIDRVDIPFEKYIDAIRELKTEFNAPVWFETILGLPGDNYESTLETINLVYAHDVDSFRSSIWMLLPEAPAFDPAVRSKFKIETKRFELSTHPFQWKPDHTPDPGVQAISSLTMISENVIGTYSYSSLEWVDMVAVSMLAGISKTLGIDLLVKYLQNELNVSAGTFYDQVYRNIIIPGKFNSPELNQKFLEIPKQLKAIISEDKIHRLEFDIDPRFPLNLSIYVYVAFVIMLYPKSFFESVTEYFSKSLNDEKLKDLGQYLANIMIDMDYNPVTKRVFETKFNWYGYFNLNKPLTSGRYEYKILDEQLKFKSSSLFEHSDYPEKTDRYEKMKQFFYHRASNTSRKKYAQHIVEGKL